MGLRDLIKKTKAPSAPSNTSSDPSSNPYAQEQQSAGPPPDYNYEPYARNQHIQQPPQGSYGGLPSGPRSGVVPGGVAPGFSTRSASNGPPLPQYPSPGAQPPPYGGSEYSPGSAGSTPVLPSATSSPGLGSGYPREKYGAQDGVGKSRYAAPAESQYGNSASLPSHRQGGYGSLDTLGGGSRANFNAPQQQSASTYSAQPDAPDGFSDETVPMTDEEREEREVGSKKAEIIQTLNDGVDVSNRINAGFDDSIARARAILGITHEQGLQMAEIEKKATIAGSRVAQGKDNLGYLDDAQGMLKFAANSQRAIQSQEAKKMNRDRDLEAQVEALDRDQRSADQEFEEMHAKIEAGHGAAEQAKSRVLGGNASDPDKHSRFAFEDDTGEQRQANQTIEGNLAETEVKAKMLKGMLTLQGKMLDRQNAQAGRITESIERSSDRLHQNKVHLETKYLRR